MAYELKEILKLNLIPGSIYYIYSERAQYGIGKSQIAYFLKIGYEEKSSNNLTKFLIFKRPPEGYKDIEEKLKACLKQCNRQRPFYVFIDEIDLIIEPDLSNEEKVKRIERLGNILIQISEEAATMGLPFYILLIFSYHILKIIENFHSSRIMRRFEALSSVDYDLKEGDFNKIARNLFALLWAMNYRNIKNKIEDKVDFFSLIGEMITDVLNNIGELGIQIESSVIGAVINIYKIIYQLIFKNVDGANLKKNNRILNNDTDLGRVIEGIVKEFIKKRISLLEFKFEETIVKVKYNEKQKEIAGFKTDGYFKFSIGDNKIGIMPVESTCEDKLDWRKKKQLKAFLNNYPILFVWIYHKKQDAKEQLQNLEDKVTKEVYTILIPLDLAKYSLLLEKRRFKLLEHFKRNLPLDIKSFLRKQARILYNTWMMEKPIPVVIGEKKKIIRNKEIHNKVEKYLENLFTYLDEKTKRSHSRMKEIMEKYLSSLNKSFDEYGISISDSDISIIYREIVEQLRSENLCRFTEIEDNKFLIKEDSFSIESAIEICEKFITVRIENKCKDKGIGIN